MDNDAEAYQTGPDIKKMLRIHHPDVRKTSLSPGRRAMKGISLHGLTRSHILADDFAQLGQAILGDHTLCMTGGGGGAILKPTMNLIIFHTCHFDHKRW